MKLNNFNTGSNIFTYKSLIKYLFLIVCAGVIVSIPGKVIKINEINCRDQYGKCNGAFENKLAPIKGKNLTNAKKEISKILTSDNAVEQYSQRFLLPGVIELSIIVRKPFCLIAESSSEDKLALLDSNGVNFGSSAVISIRPIKIDGTYNDLTEPERNKILFSCRLLKGIYNQAHITNVYFTQNQLIIDFDSDIKVIFPVEGDAKKLAGSINLILSNFIDGKSENEEDPDLKGRTIDLRFANPVVS